MMNRERVVSVTLGRAAAQHKEDLKRLAEKEVGGQLLAAKFKISRINRAAPERIDLTMET
jgi:hypothetical protein